LTCLIEKITTILSRRSRSRSPVDKKSTDTGRRPDRKSTKSENNGTKIDVEEVDIINIPRPAPPPQVDLVVFLLFQLKN
jgi:hypothetical protein